MDDNTTAAGPQLFGYPLSGLFHLLVVYIVWGSTYLAIRVAVRPGQGFPPFTLGLTRMALAGILLLLWAKARGRDILPHRRDLAVMAGAGLLLWTGGNGLVMLAEQRIDSALAALLVTTTPIWVAVMEAVLSRRSLDRSLMASLLLGFSGVVVLSIPSLQEGASGDFLSVLAVLGASFSWSVGTVLQSRNKVSLGSTANSAYQQLFGGLGFLVIVAVLQEPTPTPSVEAWWGWIYLVVAGSLLAFTSFVQALRQLPTEVAMTYGYVNPVIAVILGALILDEQITVWTVAGALLVLMGVAGVFRYRARNSRVQTANIH
jgi:drug/metabolite transporter (DMT)-like permease